MHKVAAAGMHPQRTTTDFGKRGDWQFPDDWSEVLRAEFFAELAARPILRYQAAAETGLKSEAV